MVRVDYLRLLTFKKARLIGERDGRDNLTSTELCTKQPTDEACPGASEETAAKPIDDVVVSAGHRHGGIFLALSGIPRRGGDCVLSDAIGFQGAVLVRVAVSEGFISRTDFCSPQPQQENTAAFQKQGLAVRASRRSDELHGLQADSVGRLASENRICLRDDVRHNYGPRHHPGTHLQTADVVRGLPHGDVPGSTWQKEESPPNLRGLLRMRHLRKSLPHGNLSGSIENRGRRQQPRLHPLPRMYYQMSKRRVRICRALRQVSAHYEESSLTRSTSWSSPRQPSR